MYSYNNIISDFSIAGNKISELPEVIVEWKSLRAVNLARNCLESFPEIIYELKELNILDLSYNQIKGMTLDNIFIRLSELLLQ